MSQVAVSLLVISVGVALLGCAEEPEPVAAGRAGASVVATPPDLVTKHDRCAYAVAKVAAEQFDCGADEIELHPVGASAFLTSGCDKLGTFLCDDEAGHARVVRQR